MMKMNEFFLQDLLWREMVGIWGKKNLFGGQKKDGIRMQWAQRMRLYRISSLLWS